jgi:phosphoribosylamine--glycine ligase
MENGSKSIMTLYLWHQEMWTYYYVTNVAIVVTDFDAIKALVIRKNIEMVVVGPEDPLVKGICFLNDTQLSTNSSYGPSKLGAQLEGK